MKDFKFNWGHGVVLAIASFMAFVLTLLFIADDTGDLVSDQYYEDSLVFQEVNIDAKQRVYALDEKPEIISQANGFNIQFPIEIKPDSGQVYLMRGAHRIDDIAMTLNLSSRNSILIPAARMEDGEYDLTLTWYNGGQPYLIEKTLQWSMP